MTHERFMRPSQAGLLLQTCPKKFNYRQEHPSDPSPSQAAGTAYHSYLFGGAQAEVMPFKDKRTKAAKEWWADCLARGSVPLKSGTEDHYIKEAADASRRAILERFPNRAWVPEKKLYWHHEKTPCSGTPDLVLTEDDCFPVIIEGKSWGDCSTFCRNISQKFWDAQRAGYIEAVGQEYDCEDAHVTHLFIVQELYPPYCNAFVAGEWDALEVGAAKWAAACDEHYRASREKNGWDRGFGELRQEATPFDLKNWGEGI